MNITYADFAFTQAAQIILFIVNVAVTTICYYWGASIILLIFQKKVSVSRKIIFSFIPAFFLDICVVYGVSWLNGFITGQGGFYIGVFAIPTKTMLPLSYFAMYILGVKILQLSAVKSVKLMQLSYMFYVCCNLTLRIASRLIIIKVNDERGYNYLRDIYMLLTGTVLIYLLYKAIMFGVKKFKIYANFSDNILVKNMPRELVKSFVSCCVLYVFVTLSYYYSMLDGYHCILMLIICMVYLVATVVQIYYKIYKQNIDNKDEHIASLNRSIQEFRGIKHDFNNILQTYTGFLAIQEYEQLNTYHQKMVGVMDFSEKYMSFSRRISENPSFFFLLIKKLEYADSLEIVLNADYICDLSKMYIDELDFNRIMSILFDNAIEGSQKTINKHISFSAQKKKDNSKLFILSNDADEDVDIENIFLPGYTTKEGHMGQGLYQVRNILNRYGNVTLNTTFYRKTFTIYLEVKPK